MKTAAGAISRLAELTDKPVFVVGCPRSGTTWVQRLLLSHPEICGGQESHFFSVFAPALDSCIPAQPGSRVVGLRCYWSEPDIIHEIRRLWRQTMTAVVDAFPKATVLIEKTPDHCTQIARILSVLPEARFIHVVRDPRAVAASMTAAHDQAWGAWAPSSAKAAALKWAWCVTRAREMGMPLGNRRYIEVFYEDLLEDTPTGLLTMLDFIGVKATAQQAKEYAAANSFEKQAAARDSGLFTAQGGERAKMEPPGFFNSGTADGWKRKLTLLEKLVVWRHARRGMQRFGYTWSGRRTAVPVPKLPTPATVTR